MKIFKGEGRFNIGDLLISILIAVGGGTVVGWYTANSGQLFKTLDKPFFAPPALIFPIVWPVLYLLMAIAAYRVYQVKKQGKDVEGALLFYIIQLVLNFAWPFIFFRLNLYGIAFIETIILFITIIITFIKFIRMDKLAALLLIPYILWVTYAAVLNYFIWMLNEM